MVCATSSLPVPDSPVISTDAVVGAACSIDLVDLPHLRAVADHRPERAVLAQLPAQRLHLAQRLLPLDDLVEQDLQPLDVDRLGQVVVGAFLHRLDGGLDGALRGQQQRRDVGALRLQRPQQLSPSIRGITRSVMTIAGRNDVTFSSASSPSAADSARNPQLLTSCSSPTRAA